jgi:tetratricopeptide (TPR) repeat protein/mono/diheme cytochrome c family protein
MRRILGLAAAATILAGALAPAFVHPPAYGKPEGSNSATSRSQVTFSKDIAPIIFQNCASCHHPGGSGPFSLLTSQDARKHAQQIGLVTQSRSMPPWLPEPGYGDFANGRRLTGEEIHLLQEWAAEGAPEGSPADLPPAPKFGETWELGKPDLVLNMPRPYILPPEGQKGRDVFRNFVIPVPVETTRYVRAVELHPGNPKIFHHANILVDRTGASRLRETEPGMGFAGMDLEIESESFDPDGYFLFWKPGSPPSPGSNGMSWRVDRGTDLVLNLHMRPDGKPEEIQASLGLYFADKPPTQLPILLQLENDHAIDIPPGNKDFLVKDQFTLPLDVEVLGIYPHAHYLGKDLRGYATLPDGKKKWLIWIRDWNFDWQGVFPYAKPVFLPKGSTVHMQWTYDNSSDNVRNPNHPPRRVVAGNQATDEMGHLWLQVLPVNCSGLKVDPRLILQAAIMRHRARDDPEDYMAHYNLGAALQTLGKLEEAAGEYQQVLRLRPNDPLARNSLGTVLQLLGKTEEAIQEYREVLKTRPDYSDAQYNLGRALLAQGKAGEAIASFAEVVRLRPEDADAHHNLGRALAEQGQVAQAETELEQAVRLKPDDADGHNDLGIVFARQGKLPEAATQFQEALRINPQHADAHYKLANVYAIQRKLEQAADQFELALRLEPENADFRNDFGTLLAMQGKFAEAVTQFEWALRINPDHALARENLKRALARPSTEH